MLTALRATLQQVVPTPAEPALRIVDGNVHFLARDCMREFSPDLVAVGTHARSAGATVLLGSFACDLLVDARADRTAGAGLIRIKGSLAIFPMKDPCVHFGARIHG